MVAECEESGYNKHLPGGRFHIAVKYVKQGVAKNTQETMPIVNSGFKKKLLGSAAINSFFIHCQPSLVTNALGFLVFCYKIKIIPGVKRSMMSLADLVVGVG